MRRPAEGGKNKARLVRIVLSLHKEQQNALITLLKPILTVSI